MRGVHRRKGQQSQWGWTQGHGRAVGLVQDLKRSRRGGTRGHLDTNCVPQSLTRGCGSHRGPCRRTSPWSSTPCSQGQVLAAPRVGMVRAEGRTRLLPPVPAAQQPARSRSPEKRATSGADREQLEGSRTQDQEGPRQTTRNLDTPRVSLRTKPGQQGPETHGRAGPTLSPGASG